MLHRWKKCEKNYSTIKFIFVSTQHRRICLLLTTLFLDDFFFSENSSLFSHSIGTFDGVGDVIAVIIVTNAVCWRHRVFVAPFCRCECVCHNPNHSVIYINFLKTFWPQNLVLKSSHISPFISFQPKCGNANGVCTHMRSKETTLISIIKSDDRVFVMRKNEKINWRSFWLQRNLMPKHQKSLQRRERTNYFPLEISYFSVCF